MEANSPAASPLFGRHTKSLSDDCSISVRWHRPRRRVRPRDLAGPSATRSSERCARTRRRRHHPKRGASATASSHTLVYAARATFRDTASTPTRAPRNSGAQLPKRSWRIGHTALGLQIAMHDAERMRLGDGFTRLKRNSRTRTSRKPRLPQVDYARDVLALKLCDDARLTNEAGEDRRSRAIVVSTPSAPRGWPRWMFVAA